MPYNMEILQEIADERKRQIEEIGYSKEFDEQWKGGELAIAASIYAAPEWFRERNRLTDLYPFAKHTLGYCGNRSRELVKAAALIVAEIERIERQKQEADGDRERGKIQ